MISSFLNFHGESWPSLFFTNSYICTCKNIGQCIIVTAQIILSKLWSVYMCIIRTYEKKLSMFRMLLNLFSNLKPYFWYMLCQRTFVFTIILMMGNRMIKYIFLNLDFRWFFSCFWKPVGAKQSNIAFWEEILITKPQAI